MFGVRWRLIRVFGIPISVDISWFFILALFTLMFAGIFPGMLDDVFKGASANISKIEVWALGLLTAVSFFVCILLHEMGHAIVARAQGMRIRGITLFLFGGVAEIEEEPESAWTEFWMAIAGPVVSFILGGTLFMLAGIGCQNGWAPEAVVLLGYLGGINILVLIFNMMPAFPLDGGRVLRSILWGATGDVRRATYIASMSGQVFAYFVMAFGILQVFSGNLFGVLTFLIALFLNRAAQSGYEQVVLREAMQGEPVSRFMTADPIAVEPSLDLTHWIDDFVYRYHRKGFPVVANGHLEGYVETAALKDIPPETWSRHTVGEVMRHDLPAMTIAPDADAMSALKKMQRTGASRLMVAEGDHLLGIVSVKDMMEFLNLKLQLGNTDRDDTP